MSDDTEENFYWAKSGISAEPICPKNPKIFSPRPDLLAFTSTMNFSSPNLEIDYSPENLTLNSSLSAVQWLFSPDGKKWVMRADRFWLTRVISVPTVSPPASPIAGVPVFKLEFGGPNKWDADSRKLLGAKSLLLSLVDIKAIPLDYSTVQDEAKEVVALEAKAASLKGLEMGRLAEIVVQAPGGMAAVRPVIQVTGYSDLILAGKWRTHALLMLLIDDLAGAAYQFKLDLDRGRPNQLISSGFKSVIKTPANPSFPSEHATEAMLAALIMSWITGQTPLNFELAAKRVGENQEYGGVNFGSDTKAGESLAKGLFSLLLKNDAVMALLTEARTEWP